MNTTPTKNSPYTGTEIGPIRPPSEATSLLLRVTRNCPWNKCRFCSLYKGCTFSLRKREHVLADIDAIADFVDKIKEADTLVGEERTVAIQKLNDELSAATDPSAAESALHFYNGGLESVFLQDANSLVAKTEDLLPILEQLKKRFPEIRRITSYARSRTVLDKSDEDLRALKDAGLDRIHIGMESGADRVLELMKKGATKEIHIEAGQKVKRAGIELSEYYILGLGGKEMSAENATETADAMNHIDPDFIRVRTLTVPSRVPLADDVRAGTFTQLNDVEGARELLRFLEKLNVSSYLINNDHIINLLPEASGKLDKEKERMISVVKWFLELPEHEQMIYRIGRRAGRIHDAIGLETP
ncbi:MAG: radical SAM protein, partial [Clostridiales Family XIII bacterium]|nr:radical SAM protein [Clostridiales Family XIII bacterium]